MGSNGVTLVRALSSYQCGLGSYPGVDALCGWVEFINGSLPRVERFFFLGFPLSSTDTNFFIPIQPGMVEKELSVNVNVLLRNRYLVIFLLPCRLYQDGTKGGTIQAQPWGPACCQSGGVS